MDINTPKNLAALLFLTALLTACGGGDSSSGDAPNNPAPVDNEPEDLTSEPITSEPVEVTPDEQDREPDDEVPTNAGNEPMENNAQAALSANNRFSMARTQCGLGGLSADTELDDIAIQHANYIKYVYANSTPTRFNAHVENKISDIANVTGDNNPFFGGLNFVNRLVNVNYGNAQYGVTENIAQITYSSSLGTFLATDVVADNMAKSLLAAPYHLRSLMLPTSSVVGSGVVVYKPDGKNPATNQGYVLVSHAAGTQETKNTTVSGIFTYPCQDVTNTVTALYNESPNPVRGTGRDLRTNPIGQPVYISMPSATKIKISNIKFQDTQRGTSVPTQVIDFDNDPYINTSNALPANEAFILPLTDALNSCGEVRRAANQSKQCGLYGNTKYQVSFDVLVDDTTLESQSFTFTTGNVNY